MGASLLEYDGYFEQAYMNVCSGPQVPKLWRNNTMRNPITKLSAVLYLEEGFLTISSKLRLQLIFFPSKIPWRYYLGPVNYKPTSWL